MCYERTKIDIRTNVYLFTRLSSHTYFLYEKCHKTNDDSFVYSKDDFMHNDYTMYTDNNLAKVMPNWSVFLLRS